MGPRDGLRGANPQLIDVRGYWRMTTTMTRQELIAFVLGAVFGIALAVVAFLLLTTVPGGPLTILVCILFLVAAFSVAEAILRRRSRRSRS